MQRQLERVLSLILDTIDVDYDIVVEEIRPVGPHIMVEFYALRRDNHTPINATLAYMTLTEKGQDYYYPNSNFHFVKIHMKGTCLCLWLFADEVLWFSMPVALFRPRVM